MTRGQQSSEYRAAKISTLIGVVMGMYGIAKGVDLGDLALLIGAVVLPMSAFYPASRTMVKMKKGQDV
jgi:hypothetical protein